MIEPDRLISAVPTSTEERFDRALRPITLADYVGQPVVKEQLKIFIEAARNAMSHWTTVWFLVLLA